MGLATVLGIVEQHHGFVSLDSGPGRGTAFEIHLPALDAIERSEAPRVRPPAPRARPQAAVLVVEDEPTVLSYACRTLESAGYEVIRAADAEDALARVKERAALPDALFADVVLPRMSGLELAAALRQRDPTLPVLLTTGHLGTLESQQTIAEQGWALLSKPYGVDALVYELGRLLDDRDPA
jgi:CheY-like chemotaxis protein